MNMQLRKRPGLFRRWFFRYFPMTAWYLMKDEPEIKVNKYRTRIDEFNDFDNTKEISWIILMCALTILGAVSLLIETVWILSETIKSIFLLQWN